MAIYLVQHGQSLPEEVDPQRHLSPEGEKEVRQMAAWAAARRLPVRRIVHSGKERARQTAELYAKALTPPGGVAERSGLAPLDDPQPVAAWLEHEQGVMIVGHQPFLGRLASLLLTGSPDPPVVAFSYAGIVCLQRSKEQPGWLIHWAAPPLLIG